MSNNIQDGRNTEDIYEVFKNQNVIDVELNSEMKTSFLQYAMSVIVSRALPDVRDGLKPVHRRIVYTMYEDNLLPERPYLKSATTVGDVLGRYHPHGDSSVYDAMVRMAQPFSLRYPLVDGHGNFGNIDGDGAAAYRYTEAKMSKIAVEMIRDIDKDTIDWGRNYDERLKEPQVLPSRFPNLLVNGSTGIAVGMATSIPPHNLCEVTDALIYLLENPEADDADILKFVKGPDFPTGGVIMGRSGIRAAYYTGRGKITVRAKTAIEEYKEGRYRIVVTEIPYLVSKSKIIQDIAEHVKNGRIDGISDLRDESDRSGLTIVIELKRDANPQVVLNQLFINTQLQDTFSIILLAICNGEPKIMTLKQMMQHYIAFQKDVILRRTRYDLKKALDKAHILEGLNKALDHIDQVISIIRSSKTVAEAKQRLIDGFEFSDVQAQKIVEMRLGQLTGLEREKIEQELQETLDLIADLRDVLSNDAHVVNILKEELLQIKSRYGDERRTQILNVENDIDIEDLIEEKTCVYTLTHDGYIKRLPENAYKVQRRGGRGVSAMTTKEEDYAEELFIGSTHDQILFFTDRGRAYKIKGYEIPESSRQAKGMNVVNLISLQPDEKITSMIAVNDLKADGLFFNMITRRGVTKRCRVGDFRNMRSAGLIALSLDEDDELVCVHLTDGGRNIIVATSDGMAIKYNESQVSIVGRNARGVRALKLGAGAHVVGSAVEADDRKLLAVTENGYGKVCGFEEFNVQHRGGVGVRCHKINAKTGALAAFMSVGKDEDLLVISSDGVIIRVRMTDIPMYSRNSGGVRIMRLNDGVKVVNIACVAAESEGEMDGAAETETHDSLPDDGQNGSEQ